jgi:hypothetical protein
VGDYLTGSAEVVFGLPGDLNYSKNGMIYGARLYDATRSLRISDPEFAANLDEHFRQCVFYDVLLGRYSMKELAESGDIWTTIAPGSQARAQRFLTRDAGSGEVSSNIVTCREAYGALNGQWASLVDSMGTVFGRQLYPNQTAALAKAKLFADLPVAYQYLTGVSANATDIFKQTLTINAMGQALQSRFVAQYAEALQKGISARIALHDGPLVTRPISSSEQTVRERATIGGAVSTSPNQAPAEQIGEEVASARMEGRSKIESNRRTLEELTRGANGASAQSADAIKDWER